MRGNNKPATDNRMPPRASTGSEKTAADVSGACQSRVQALKDGHHRTAVTEGVLDRPTGVDHPRGQVHQLLHDGTNASAFGAVAQRGIRAQQAVLPCPAQDVVGEHGAGEDQGIGGEFARRQALDVQVGLEFAVVLLGGAVVGIQGDNRLFVEPQAPPPAFDLDLGNQKALAALVDGALDHAHDAPQGVLVAVVGARFDDVEQGDALTRTRLAPIAVCPRHRRASARGFPGAGST
jgi:hypothetical protein